MYPLNRGYIELFGTKNSDIAMARAKRHYIPGQIWHITHRCHNGEFLLKFAKENGDHLIKCIVYTDLNMVRAGVVKHPSEWPYSGYNEIQQPKRKKILINYERLKELLGFDSYEHVKTAHKQWVESCLSDGDNFRDSKWTESIAVGSESYIQNVKALMGGMALGRKVLETGELFQLKEVQYPYIAHLGAKKIDIGNQNTYFWNQNYENTTT